MTPPGRPLWSISTGMNITFGDHTKPYRWVRVKPRLAASPAHYPDEIVVRTWWFGRKRIETATRTVWEWHK